MYISKADLTTMNPRVREQVEAALGVQTQSKYRNKKTIMGGRTFDSIKEAERYADLQMLMLKDIITDLRLQVPFKVSEKITYVADFVYFDLEKKEWVVEDSKGMRTHEYKLKAKLFQEKYGFPILET